MPTSAQNNSRTPLGLCGTDSVPVAVMAYGGVTGVMYRVEYIVHQTQGNNHTIIAERF